MPIDDGLDELDDVTLQSLAAQAQIPNWQTMTNRRQLIKELRRRNVTSPYSRKTQPPDDMGLPQHPADSDIEEYDDIQGIIDDYYRMIQEGETVEAWRVTLSSGNQVTVYGTMAGLSEVEAQGFRVEPMNDDYMVTVEEFQGQSAMPSDPGMVEKRRRPPRLPRRRIGKHQAGEVVEMSEQRSKPAKGEPSLPFGYEPSEKVTHFPRHRNRER